MQKIIWSYWNGEKLPYLVNLAVGSWKHFNPSYEIRLLALDSLSNYVLPETLPGCFHLLSAQRQADLLRTIVLELHGGIWCDATMLICCSLDTWLPNSYFDLFGFECRLMTTDDRFKVIENWFLAAPKGSKLISMWKNEVLACIKFFKEDEETPSSFVPRQAGQNYQTQQMLRRYVDSVRDQGIDFQNLGIALPYLSMHLGYQVVIQKNQSLNFTVASLDSTARFCPFEILERFRRQDSAVVRVNSQGFVEYILGTESAKESFPYALKFRKNERRYFDTMYKFMHVESLMGRLAHTLSDTVRQKKSGR